MSEKIGGRDPILSPKEGDRWNEGEGINGMTHIVKLVGTSKIAILYDNGKERCISLTIFRRNCKRRWNFGGTVAARPSGELVPVSTPEECGTEHPTLSVKCQQTTEHKVHTFTDCEHGRDENWIDPPQSGELTPVSSTLDFAQDLKATSLVPETIPNTRTGSPFSRPVSTSWYEDVFGGHNPEHDRKFSEESPSGETAVTDGPLPSTFIARERKLGNIVGGETAVVSRSSWCDCDEANPYQEKCLKCKRTIYYVGKHGPVPSIRPPTINFYSGNGTFCKKYKPAEPTPVSTPSPSLQKEMVEALEAAQNGLRWYHETYPAVVNSCDHEAMQQIDAALARAKKEMGR